MGRRLRVVQWTTGKAGAAAVRGVAAHPVLDLVGCYAYAAAWRFSQRNAPVVNRIDGRALRFDLKRGKPADLPLRLPSRESPQFFSARASWSRPVLNASFEHSPHHGATSFLAAFQSLRSEYSDHEMPGVRPSPVMPWWWNRSRSPR